MVGRYLTTILNKLWNLEEGKFLEEVIKEFTKELGVDACAIYVYEPQKDRFSLNYYEGLEPRPVRFIGSESPLSDLIKKGESIKARAGELPLPLKGVRTLLITPISTSDEVLGAFLVASRKDMMFDDKFETFIRGLVFLLALYFKSEEMREELSRRYAEREKEGNRFKRALDAVPLGIYIVDSERRITFVNRKEREGFGVGAEALGKKCFSVFGDSGVPCRGCPLDEVLENREDFTLYEVSETEFGRLLGREKANIYFKPISHSEVLVAIEDLTEVEEERRRLEIRTKLEAVGEFAAAMINELNDPLLVCNLSLERIKTKSCEEVEKLEKALRKIESFARSLSSLARPVSKQMDRFDLGELAEELLETMEELKGVPLHFHKKSIEVFSDREAVKLILANLLRNAVEAVKEKGKGEVFLKLDKVPGWAVIEVKDTGVGVPEKFKKRIFEPFYTTKKRALGLGLSICKHLIDELRGKIELTTNGGTVFRVFLRI